jgi:heme/copper-type cytochrome/quinol oxidase subunit 2
VGTSCNSAAVIQIQRVLVQLWLLLLLLLLLLLVDVVVLLVVIVVVQVRLALRKNHRGAHTHAQNFKTALLRHTCTFVRICWCR